MFNFGSLFLFVKFLSLFIFFSSFFFFFQIFSSSSSMATTSKTGPLWILPEETLLSKNDKNQPVYFFSFFFFYFFSLHICFLFMIMFLHCLCLPLCIMSCHYVCSIFCDVMWCDVIWYDVNLLHAVCCALCVQLSYVIHGRAQCRWGVLCRGVLTIHDKEGGKTLLVITKAAMLSVKKLQGIEHLYDFLFLCFFFSFSLFLFFTFLSYLHSYFHKYPSFSAQDMLAISLSIAIPNLPTAKPILFAFNNKEVPLFNFSSQFFFFFLLCLKSQEQGEWFTAFHGCIREGENREIPLSDLVAVPQGPAQSFDGVEVRKALLEVLSLHKFQQLNDIWEVLMT